MLCRISTGKCHVEMLVHIQQACIYKHMQDEVGAHEQKFRRVKVVNLSRSVVINLHNIRAQERLLMYVIHSLASTQAFSHVLIPELFHLPVIDSCESTSIGSRTCCRIAITGSNWEITIEELSMDCCLRCWCQCECQRGCRTFYIKSATISFFPTNIWDNFVRF